jgi:hypothetical protein
MVWGILVQGLTSIGSWIAGHTPIVDLVGQNVAHCI